MSEIISPEHLEEEGKRAYAEERFEDAINAFKAAVEGFAAKNEPVKAAEMQNNLSVIHLQAGDADEALAAVGDTPVFFEAANEPLKRAMAIGNQAAALEALEKYAEAEEHYRTCAVLLKELGENELRATVMQSISRLQMRTGRYLEAVSSMQSRLDQIQKPSARQRFLKKLLDLPFKLMGQPRK